MKMVISLSNEILTFLGASPFTSSVSLLQLGHGTQARHPND
jgi:hypothetical protein